MSVLPLESGIMYGPVFSRRLGLSLGVNILPTGCKVCSFDCVYCHYGGTPHASLRPSAHDMPWPRDVEREVEKALRRYPGVDYLTFSGNGEPTLHPAFDEIAAAVRELCEKLAPRVKLALFSNASTISAVRVRRALPLFDTAMLKLDAGDPATFAAINRPAREARWWDIVEGLRETRTAVIQSVLVDGPVSNTRGPAFRAWTDAIATIRPSRVVIYSTDYPVPEAAVQRVPPYRLDRLAQEATQQTGVCVEARFLTG